MTTTGPKPVPSHLKMVRGTDQPCRMRDDEPKPAADKIRRPRGLSPLAVKEWDKVAPQLQQAGILTNIDLTALVLYCESMATFYDAVEKLRVKGSVARGKAGPMVSPWYKVARDSAEQARKLAVEFGMTPSSRTRISSTKKDKPKSNGWEDFD